MAHWTATEWTAVVVACGTFVLAVAAVLQFGLARRTAQRQLRAYVFPDSATLTDGTQLTPPQPARANVPGVVVLIKNFGQTPARQAVSWAGIDVIEPRHEATLATPRLPQTFANALGAGAFTSKALWFTRPLNQQEIVDVAAGAKAIYVFGRAEYRDVFGHRRFTNFRLRYSGQFPPVPGAVFNFAESGNDAN